MIEISIKVTASLDDGTRSYSPDTFDATGLLIAGVQPPLSIYHSFMRFLNLQIPAGSTVLEAFLELSDESAIFTGPVNTRIYGNDADNATAPTSVAEFDALVRTTAFTDWDIEAVDWPGDNDQTLYKRSPAITSIIQEIIDRPGWALGNAIQLLWLDDGTAIVDSAVANSWDSWPNGTNAPRLIIVLASDALAVLNVGGTANFLPFEEVSIASSRNPTQIPQPGGGGPIIIDLEEYRRTIEISGVIPETFDSSNTEFGPSKNQLEDIITDDWNSTQTLTIYSDVYEGKPEKLMLEMNAANEEYWKYTLIFAAEGRA